jgi:hypothetical protein
LTESPGDSPSAFPGAPNSTLLSEGEAVTVTATGSDPNERSAAKEGTVERSEDTRAAVARTTLGTMGSNPGEREV